MHISWLRKKSIITVAKIASSPLPRTMGLLELFVLGVAAVVGTGVFVLTGQVAARNAGPAVVISYGLAAMAAIFSGLCYAELAAMLPLGGGAYAFAYAAMGELLAFVMGWDLLLEFGAATATVAMGWGSYVQALWPQLGWLQDHWLAVVAIALVTITVARGHQATMPLLKGMVLIKLMVIGVFVAAMLPLLKVANLQPFVPRNLGQFGHFGWSGIFQGACVLFFAYGGFDAVATASAEAKNPRRDIPLAMIGSITLAATLYSLVSLGLLGAVSYRQLAVADPLAKGIAVARMPILALMVNLGACLGLFSVLLVQLSSLVRVGFAMGEDGLLPALPLHKQWQVPTWLTLMLGGIVALATLWMPIDLCGELTSCSVLFAFVLVSAMVILLRWQKPQVARPFRVPGHAWGIPLASLLVSTGLLLSASWQSLLGLLLWLFLGIVVYGGYGLRHAKLAQNT